MFCKSCGKELKEGDIYCPNCGADQRLNYTREPLKPIGKRSMVNSAILAFLLGRFGAHNFYLGKTKLALMQLLPYVGLILIQIVFIILKYTHSYDWQICNYMLILVSVFKGLISTWAFTEFVLILFDKITDNEGLPLTK